MDKNYINNLEKFVEKMLNPIKNAPYEVIIKCISGCSVLSFEKNNKFVNLLKEIFDNVGRNINIKGIFAKRPNEVGNKIEPFVRKSLSKFGLTADIPTNKNGRKIAVGYPDIIFKYHTQYYYLECKTYNTNNYDTTQRSFYFSPSRNFKITKDACHLMVSFQIIKKNKKYFANHWKLFSLKNMLVDLKHEFNQSNRKMYGSNRCIDLIAEEKI